MDLWQGLDVFLSVVSEGSFTAAARKSNVSVAHVSRQVGYLEDRLGVVLFKRNTRKMLLTDSGRHYASKLKEIRQQLLNLNEEVQGEDSQLQGPIAISCSVGYASRQLTTLLARFAAENPKVSLRIDYSPRNVDLVDDGFDLAIRFGKPADSNLTARRLSQRPMTLVASPDYLAVHGTPQHPDDLSTHNCLVATNRRWQFQNGSDPFTVNVNGNWSSNNADALINACLTGLGISYLAADLILPQVNQGTLVSLLSEFCPVDNGSWLLYSGSNQPSRVRLLIEYLIKNHG